MIRVMTVHASKGLEFPVVYLPGLVQQRFPMKKMHNFAPPPAGMLAAGSEDEAAHEEMDVLAKADELPSDLSKWPPTLLITGTRDAVLSSTFLEVAAASSRSNTRACKPRPVASWSTLAAARPANTGFRSRLTASRAISSPV